MTEMNEKLFYELTRESDKPVLVDFWATWCVYCHHIAPALAVLSREREDIVFAKVNIDDEPGLARAEHIEVIPTLVLYHKGEALGSIVAPESKSRIEEFLEETLGDI